MNRLSHRLALALMTAPLALALSACGAEDDTAATAGSGPAGEPVEAVAAPEGQQWSEVITKTEQGGLWTPQEIAEKMSGILLPD